MVDDPNPEREPSPEAKRRIVEWADGALRRCPKCGRRLYAHTSATDDRCQPCRNANPGDLVNAEIADEMQK